MMVSPWRRAVAKRLMAVLADAEGPLSLFDLTERTGMRIGPVTQQLDRWIASGELRMFLKRTNSSSKRYYQLQREFNL